ncbi:tetratricopeptide repeat protein [Candidatus Parabeggiatoa sp. HSG14]|uniref:tetratricopeptide repeat protein n=1 Tax=Candidatus Parabeggiatoa sp. HSG14 TaxID=3055593 RepID=UPI0025A88FDA|nr:tetratricopeptide repeat protein [Thiotrichales bacterium HSG14]
MRHYIFLSFIFFIAFTPAHATSDVSQLLKQCENHLKANRLTSGLGGTALVCYEEVLDKEPSNAKALAGIEEIEARYAKWAKRALNRGQKNKAKQYLASLRQVNPESPILAELEARLQPPSSTPTTPSSTIQSDKTTPPQSETTSQPSEANPPADETTSQPKPSEASPSPSESTSQPSKEPPPQKKAQIVDVGHVYEAINTTECLTWPTPGLRDKSGKNSWDSFYPKKDDIGIIVEELKHCQFDDIIYILKIDQYYVPISNAGTKVVD